MSRYFLDDVWYFITVPTISHQPFFDEPQKKQFLLEKMQTSFLEQEIKKMDFSIMADHYHFLAHLKKGAIIPKLLKHINGPSAMYIKKQLGLPGGIWDEYHIYIASTEQLYERIRGYTIGNPIKHGDVSNLDQLATYPFSTFKNVVNSEGREYAEDIVNSVIEMGEDQFFKSLPRTGTSSL